MNKFTEKIRSLHGYSLAKDNYIVSLQDIEHFENQIGIRLPKDYVDFVTKNIDIIQKELDDNYHLDYNFDYFGYHLNNHLFDYD